MSRPDVKGDDDANDDNTYLGWVAYWITAYGRRDYSRGFHSLAAYINDRAPLNEAGDE